MEDGTVHAGVALGWILEGSLLEIEGADGLRRSVSPLRVKTILDASGRDITNEVARAGKSPMVRYDNLGEGRTRPFHFRAMAFGGGAYTVIQATGGFHPSGAGFGGLRVAVAGDFHLNLGYRHQVVNEGYEREVGNLEVVSREWHALAGVRIMHPRGGNNFVYAEAGLAFIELEDRLDRDNMVWTDQSDRATAYVLQGGIIFPLKYSVGLDVGAILSARPGLNSGEDRGAVLFGLQGALTWRF